MRAYEILLETKDENGLIRNNRNDDYSIFKNVTAVGVDFKRGRSDPWIAYVSVTNPDLLELVEEYGWSRIGLGHKTFLSIARFEDERDAAYVGQKFAEDLEENVMKVLSGEDWESVVGQIPNWMGVAPPLNHSSRKILPEITPRTPQIFNVEKATAIILKLERQLKYRINTNDISMNYNLPDLLKIMEFLVINKATKYEDAARAAALHLIDQNKAKKQN